MLYFIAYTATIASNIKSTDNLSIHNDGCCTERLLVRTYFIRLLIR